MKPRILIVLLLAICLAFATGFISHPYLSGLAHVGGSQTQTLTFDANVKAYSYSEKGVIEIEKIDDRNYAITAVNPGMCVLTFSTGDDSGIPPHARRGRFIVSVSPNNSLTIQETNFVAEGML